jgi:type IV secretory pathway TraG/TraD family ATPase VirD4
MLMTAILDELPNATPIPQLPDIIADSAGRGVLIHWAAQSAAQLEDTFTPPRARQLLDNTATLSIWGGLKDGQTLQWASTLTGHREHLRWQHHADGLMLPGRTSLGTETVPTYRAGEVRTLRRGHVLIIHRGLDPILARTIDISERADWRQLAATSTGSALAMSMSTSPVTPLDPAQLLARPNRPADRRQLRMPNFV